MGRNTGCWCASCAASFLEEFSPQEVAEEVAFRIDLEDRIRPLIWAGTVGIGVLDGAG